MTWAVRAFAEDGIDPRAARIVAHATESGRTLATGESLTGGALVSGLVDVPGASRCVVGGAVCYSLAAKTRLLGVDADVLAATGAVTAEVAAAMARGALRAYDADLAVSTTGVAGPGPDERGIGQGTVFVALADAARGTVDVRELHLVGDRAEVRRQTVDAGLALFDEALAQVRDDGRS